MASQRNMVKDSYFCGDEVEREIVPKGIVIYTRNPHP